MSYIYMCVCVGAQENMTFGLSYEKNEAVLTACYFVIISKMPHETMD